jgi:hypothetical protein
VSSIIVLVLGGHLNWPIADAPQFRRRLSLSGYQKVFAAAVFAVHMYVLVRILWRDWGIGAIFASLVIAALMTTLIVLAQFLLMPAINRRVAPMPIARLLGQSYPPAAGPPVHGGMSLTALRPERVSPDTLPHGDESNTARGIAGTTPTLNAGRPGRRRNAVRTTSGLT